MPVTAEIAKQSSQRVWVEVRLDRLRANLKTIRDQIGPAASIMAVVKANAYGHGMVDVAKALKGEASFLGVSSVEEALKLKEHGIETPIFLFGCLMRSEIPSVITDGITLSVSSLEEAQEISAVSLSMKRKTPVHVKIDTGMGRLGIPLGDAINRIEKMAAFSGISLEGIYTHFPTAERKDGFTERQVQDFVLLIKALETKNIRFKWRHAQNSAGIFNIQNEWLNLVRPGLMMYGLYPDPSLAETTKLAPVLSLKSRILLIKRIAPGDSVGYGRNFKAEKPTFIATIAAGYSHGYPVSASGKSYALYLGKRYRLAGRVSMDYLAVDLGDTRANAGDEITLIGEENDAAVSAEELAAWAGTIPYEIVTRLPSSLPRIYR